MSDTDIQRVSYSSIQQHRQCPQKWYYNRILRLEAVPDPTDSKVEMNFGSWWHALRAVDSLERGAALGTIRHWPKEITTDDGGPTFDPREVSKDDVFDAAEKRWDKYPDEVQNSWLDRLGASLPDRLEYVNARWEDHNAEAIADEEPLAVEMGWGRNLPPLPDGTDPRTRAVGYIDEVVRSRRRGLIIARDHKTGKRLDQQTSLTDMMDSQLQFYAWGADPQVREWGMGPITATSYDRVCSVAAKAPELTKSGRLSQRNGVPSIGSTDLHTYRTWAGEGVEFPGLKKDGSGAGIYEIEPAIVERLSTPAAQSQWFQRTLTPLNLNVVRTHLRAAVDSAVDSALTAQRAAEAGEAPRNLGGASCRWCDYVHLCRAQMMGGPRGEYDLASLKVQAKEERT